MESDDFETPETLDEPGTDAGPTAPLSTGRLKRLRADGAPRDLHVVRVSRP